MYGMEADHRVGFPHCTSTRNLHIIQCRSKIFEHLRIQLLTYTRKYYTSRDETDKEYDLPIAKYLEATFEFSRFAKNESTAIFAAIEVEEPPCHRIAVKLQDRVLDE